MLKIYTDFNARTPDGDCWILIHDERDLSDKVGQLGIQKSDRIILYQDPEDFEVIGTLDYRYDNFLCKEAWLARPDWTTITSK